MAFPTFTSAVAFEGADTTSWDWTLPSGNAAGKQLVLIIYSDLNTNSVSSGLTGFTLLGSQSGGVNCLVYAKITDGAEASGVITMASSDRGAVHSTLWTGAHASTLPEVAFNAASADPATFSALNPAGWGTEDTAWMAALGISSSTEESIGWSPPTGYTLIQLQDSGGTGNDVQTALWYINSAVASETPGSVAFDLGSAAFVTATIGIRPAGAGAASQNPVNFTNRRQRQKPLLAM